MYFNGDAAAAADADARRGQTLNKMKILNCGFRKATVAE